MKILGHFTQCYFMTVGEIAGRKFTDSLSGTTMCEIYKIQSLVMYIPTLHLQEGSILVSLTLS